MIEGNPGLWQRESHQQRPYISELKLNMPPAVRNFVVAGLMNCDCQPNKLIHRDSLIWVVSLRMYSSRSDLIAGLICFDHSRNDRY